MEVVDYQIRHRVDESDGLAAPSTERVIVRLDYEGEAVIGLGVSTLITRRVLRM